MATRFLDIFGLEHYHSLINSIFKKKEDIVVIDFNYPSVENGNIVGKSIDISSYIEDKNINNYVVISIGTDWFQNNNWHYMYQIKTDEMITFPRAILMYYGADPYLETSVYNDKNQTLTPKGRVVLMKIT